MGQKGYSPEFRQRALDLLGSGRKVVDNAENPRPEGRGFSDDSS